jgi:hypothetical protein
MGENFMHVEVAHNSEVPQHAQLGSMSQISVGSLVHSVALKVVVNLAKARKAHAALAARKENVA